MVELLTTEQAAEDAQLSRVTIMLHITKGNLPATRCGQRWVIFREDLDKFLEKRANGMYVQGWKNRWGLVKR